MAGFLAFKSLDVYWTFGAPEEIRTPDPQIRSLVFYPAELRALGCVYLRGRIPPISGDLRMTAAAFCRGSLNDGLWFFFAIRLAPPVTRPPYISRKFAKRWQSR